MPSPRNADATVGTAPEIPLILDLAAILGPGQAVYLKLGPEGAVLSVKGAESFAEGMAFGPEWTRMTPEERARAVLGWIRKAATQCRHPRIRWGPLRPQPAWAGG